MVSLMTSLIFFSGHVSRQWFAIHWPIQAMVHVITPSACSILSRYAPYVGAHGEELWCNQKCINCEKCLNLLFSQILHFSSVLLTKNEKSFDIFRGGSGELRRKMYKKKKMFLHFSFSVATKNIKILLQAREVTTSTIDFTWIRRKKSR